MKKFIAMAAFITIDALSGFARAQTIQSPYQLNGAQYVLFTDPKDCGWCRQLETVLKSTGQETAIHFNYGNTQIVMPIVRYNPWSADGQQIAQFKKLGYLNTGIPQFAIIKNGRVLGVGSDALDSLAGAIQKRGSDFFLGRPGESTSAYDKRIEAAINNNNIYDFSSAIYAAVGLNNLAIDGMNMSFSPEKIGPHNILIAGTGMLPTENPVFTGITIEKVLGDLSALNPSVRPTVLYGGGKTSLCDTCERKPGAKNDNSEKALELTRVQGLNPDGMFTVRDFDTYFKTISEYSVKTNLVVLVGHGAPDGVITWLNVNDLPPKQFGQIVHQSSAPTVLVDGNCYGGLLAEQVQCGFFGAPPNREATGCYLGAKDSLHAHDYVSEFFKSLQHRSADVLGNGRITFAEAHAYATLHVNKHDHPYTTWDDLARKYFTAHIDQFPATVSAATFEREYLDTVGSAVDKDLYMQLLAHAKTDTISLKPIGFNFANKNFSFTVTHNPDGGDNSTYNFSNITLLNWQGLGLKSGDSVRVFRVEPGQYALEKYNPQNNYWSIVSTVSVVEPASFSYAMDDLRALALRLIYEKIMLLSSNPNLAPQRNRLMQVIQCGDEPISEFVQ